ncbi:hypothetical protein B0T21DRAFT_357744 [Apiosordaria backusii]|uniref:Amidoligase enzyme n=1 Tax=Apiosordaria backusii TaxID=314023 RepID=A0AA40ERY1_9PEZI|nr:hypothetical protein B0T21DRAFT_357744 [Apiosordaria backusii]
MIPFFTKLEVEASTERAGFGQWTITQDPALTEIPVRGECGFWNIELVSRILRTDEDWVGEISRAFEALTECCEIKLTTGCSMHIHVSPVRELAEKPNQFTFPEIVNIVKAVAYFDQPLTDVMPAERKQNAFALSSFTGVPPPDDREAIRLFDEPKRLKLQNLYGMVPTAGWGPLFKHLEQITSRVKFRHNCDLSRLRSFNFSPLLDDNCLTIEFRRPPGADTAAKATKWAAFALCFFAAAIDPSWNAHTSKPSLRNSKSLPSLKDFQSFLERGRAVLGIDVFDPNVLVVNNAAPVILTAAAIARLKSKKAEMDSESVFESKLSSRSNTPTSQTSKHSFRDRSNSPTAGRGTDGKPTIPAAAARPTTPTGGPKASSSTPKTPPKPSPKPSSKPSPKPSPSQSPPKPASTARESPKRNIPASSPLNPGRKGSSDHHPASSSSPGRANSSQTQPATTQLPTRNKAPRIDTNVAPSVRGGQTSTRSQTGTQSPRSGSNSSTSSGHTHSPACNWGRDGCCTVS